jgi:hypothetical protein
MEFGTDFVDVVLWTQDEREQIAWNTANEVYGLGLVARKRSSVASLGASALESVSMIEESAS